MFSRRNRRPAHERIEAELVDYVVQLQKHIAQASGDVERLSASLPESIYQDEFLLHIASLVDMTDRLDGWLAQVRATRANILAEDR